MKLSFSTLGCPSWKLEQIAANAAAMGFDGVELRGIAGEHIGPDESPAERRRIRALFADQGVAIACIMGYTRFTMTDPQKRAENDAGLAKLLALASDVGCHLVRVFGGQLEATDRRANIERVVAGLRPLAAQALTLGVRIALETHDDWCRGQDIRAVLDGVDSPALGVCWDIANASLAEPQEATFAAIADRIIHVHFKDVARAGDEVHSRLPGTGEVNLRQALTWLRDSAYRGYLSFEWEKKWEPDIPEPEIAFPHYAQFVSGLMRELDVPRG
jgi:sugar phosphate isomerase/epimerase